MAESNPNRSAETPPATRTPDAGRRPAAPREVLLHPLAVEHWPRVCEIYEHGIRSGNATFQTGQPSWEEWDAGHLAAPRVVATEGDVILGWAALSPISRRPVYAGVAEVSVYVAAEARGHGVGGRLLLELVRASEASGIWTLQAGVFPENVASIALHERCGFRVVGRREWIGSMHGRWRDVTLMERRSQTVGR